MSHEQRLKCHRIIHCAAIAAGAENLLPVPGTDVAADMVALTGMSKELSKLMPQPGQLLAPCLSAGLIEAAGWSIASDLAQRQQRLVAV